MKTSERLRELAADERWRSHDPTVLSGLALTFHDVSGGGILPLIADVVEAAEQLALSVKVRSEPLPLALLSESDSVLAALTALRDALEEK